MVSKPDPMSVSPSEFRRALGNFATGVTVVTARGANGAQIGITVSSFASLSLDPPLVLFCLDRQATCFATLRRAKQFAINVLNDGQADLSRLFADRKADKWRNVEAISGACGAPLIEGCIAHIECRREASREGGDHVIMVGRVERVATFPGRPLLYHRSGYHHLGQQL
jgi:flavin reductase (DIM6/NTAB) family NADH-FMN oxidoreductase RutF